MLHTGNSWLRAGSVPWLNSALICQVLWMKDPCHSHDTCTQNVTSEFRQPCRSRCSIHKLALHFIAFYWSTLSGCTLLLSCLAFLCFQTVPSFQFQLVSALLGRTDLVLGLGQQLRMEIVGVDYYLMLLPCQVVFDALMLSLISTTLRQCPGSLCMGTPFLSRENGSIVDIMVHF